MGRSSRQRLRARRFRGKRGVSDILGTILILALTVVLFSSIFFFVSTFPKPATQPNSQFQGQLFYSFASKGGHSWTNISFLAITHLAGPTIYAFNTQVYVVSQSHPQNTTTIYNLASGGLGSSTSASWGTGQVWNVSLASDHLNIPDNLTVTVVSAGSVVYRQTLPGTNPTIPPIFDQEGTIPAAPSANQSFSIFVQISDPFLSTTSKRVYANITTPGMTCVNPLGGGYASNKTIRLQMAFNSTSGFWIVPNCKATSSGTYYVTAWVTDSNPIVIQQNSFLFPVLVSGSGGGGGGGGCSNTFTATLTANPTTTVDSSAVTLNLTIVNGNTCDWIYISGNYTGSVTAGTYVAPLKTAYSLQTVPVGGSLSLVTTWTTPAATCNPGGNKPCNGTGTITFTFSYTSGAVGTKTYSVTITY